MDRRKFLKLFSFGGVVVGASGCVATYNGRDMKIEKDYVPPEKKHFERPLTYKLPSSPKLNDILTTDDYKLYAYNGKDWILIGEPVKIKMKG